MIVLGRMVIFFFACAPDSGLESLPAPLLRDRLAANPPPQPAPEGALLSIAGAPWSSPSPPDRRARLVPFETGRWATFDGQRWALWDPERGFLREVPSRGDPTPDGAWLIEDFRSDPVRLDTEVVVDGVHEARVDSFEVSWGETAARATAKAVPVPEDPRCQRSWRSGKHLACYKQRVLSLFDGEKQLGSWNGSPSSVSWSADGETFAWSGSGQLTIWRDEGEHTSHVDLAQMALSQDGSLVIGWSVDGFIFIDTETGDHLEPKDHSFPAIAGLGPGGEIVAWMNDGTLRTWDSSGRPLGQTPVTKPASLTWGRDGVCTSLEAEQLCFNADLTLRSRFEIPTGGRSIGAHLLVPVQGGVLIDGRFEEGNIGGFDSSGEQVILMGGEYKAIDLASGDTSLAPITFSRPLLSRGGRRLEQRPNGTLVVWPEAELYPVTPIPLDREEWRLWTRLQPVRSAECEADDPQFIPGPDRRLALVEQTVPADLPQRGLVASGGGRAAIVDAAAIHSVDPWTGEQWIETDAPWELWLPDGRWAGDMLERVERLTVSESGAKLAALTSAGRLFLIDRSSGEGESRCAFASKTLSFAGEGLLLDDGRITVSPEGTMRITSAAGMELRISDEGEVFAHRSGCGWFRVARDGVVEPSADPGLPKRAPMVRREGDTLLVESLDPSLRGCQVHDPQGAVLSPSGRQIAWAGPRGVWRADRSTCAALSPEISPVPSGRRRGRSYTNPLQTFGERAYAVVDGRVGAFVVPKGSTPVLSGAGVIAFSGRTRSGQAFEGRELQPRFHPTLANIEAIAVLPTGELAVASRGRIALVEPW